MSGISTTTRPVKDDLPLFEDYLNDSFPCSDLFFNPNGDMDESPLIRSYSEDHTAPSSPESNPSSDSKDESANEADSDVSLAIRLSNSTDQSGRPASEKLADVAATAEDPVPGMRESKQSLPHHDSTAVRSNYQLNLHGIPAKSRVETQIRLGLQLVQIDHVLGIPSEVDIGERFQWLKLPSWAMAKEKLKMQNRKDAPTAIDPDRIIFLEARVVKSSEPPEDVVICSGCVVRERKRAQRKKDSPKKQTTTVMTDDKKSESAELVPLPDEEKKILVFNCPELLEIFNGQVTIPTRVTCYCRHHKEKDGFRIIITLRDATNQILASTTSELVLITDDHKTSGKVQKNKEQVTSSVKGQPYFLGSGHTDSNSISKLGNTQRAATHTSTDWTDLMQTDTSNSTLKNLSRRSSVSSNTATKKRKAEAVMQCPAINFTKIQKVPSSLSMTNLPGLHTSHRDPPCVMPLSTGTSRATSPSLDQRIFKRSPSQDSLLHFMNDASYNSAYSHMVNSPQYQRSVDPSTSPQRSGFFDTSMDEVMHDRSLSHSPRTRTRDYIMESAKRYNHSPQNRSIIMPPTREASIDAPTVSRMIPAEGPLQGGIEITILGCGFYPGMTAMFGDTPAVPTHCWSPTTLICILPPATNAGPVPLTLKEHPYNPASKIFTYIDDTDRALMELALQVIGLKTTGRLETARDVAMRICSSKMPSESADANLKSVPVQHLRASLGLPSNNLSTEELVLRCLSYLDSTSNQRTTRISQRSKGGHTMLHLAAIKGYDLLVKELLIRGANSNIRDRASLTPLHTAALHSHIEVCKLLLLDGNANLSLATSDGRTAYDIALATGESDILDVLDPWNKNSQHIDSMSLYSSGSDSLASYSADFEDGSVCSDSSALPRIPHKNFRGLQPFTGIRSSARSRSSGSQTQPVSRSTSPSLEFAGARSFDKRHRSKSLGNIDLLSLLTVPNAGLAKIPLEKKEKTEKDTNYDERHLAKSLLDLQNTWMAFLSETSPVWLQKTLANANASLPDVLRASNLAQISEIQFLQASPITAFQAMLPHISNFRPSNRNADDSAQLPSKVSHNADTGWLQNIVASLGSPPSYAEATSRTLAETHDNLGTSRSTLSDDIEVKSCETGREIHSWWKSKRAPLRSQGRIADMTPAEQRAQAKKFQKPADRMMFFFWLPCLLFFIVVSIGKAVFGKLFDLVL